MPRIRIATALARPAVVLFLCLFASQAGFLVLSAVLPVVARDLGASPAAVGQLRALTGLAGGATAIALVAAGGRPGPRRALAHGLRLMLAASAISAAAPGMLVLGAAQALLGVASALLLAGGVAAVAEWSGPGERAGVLAWALVGQPAAWVAGLPAIGVLAGGGWRAAWLVPALAAVAALALLSRRAADAPARPPQRALRALLGDGDVRRWAVGELLAYCAWSGALVFAGALLVESHGASPATAGLALGAAAAAYFPGTFLARRWVDAHARALLAGLGLACAAGVAAFGLVRPTLAVSALLFALLVGLAGARTLAGSAHGLVVGAAHPATAVTGLRTAAAQFGNLGGAGLGGVALGA
ncbi:MAG TPA: MFS transporter, partial [Solirubrobacteraceae bacterium]|nr:MFS transporter [Solirubrobacteraceae bacterium]